MHVLRRVRVHVRRRSFALPRNDEKVLRGRRRRREGGDATWRTAKVEMRTMKGERA